ncbi:hypothetical protein SDC9_87579 [bioreactor metagenome]|uniref:DUF11 domain-containing protein n=1 Tax=bioreactor metagenome TaxID=1076179 RepID=A0A644ZJ71_9ZZZZ
MSVPVNFKGSLVNTATVAPPAGLTDPNAGDNTATQTATSSTRTPSVVDLQIVKSSNGSYTPGSDKVYSIVVTNHGPDAATGVTVSDPLPASVTAASWSCTAGAGASCTGSGSGAIYDTAVNLPSGSSVTYSLTLNVPASYTGDLVNKADATLPADFIDTAPENNSSTDVSKLATQMPPANVPVNSGWMLLMLVALLGWQATRSKTS